MHIPELALASDMARVRAMYKLVSPPASLQVLELVSPGKPAVACGAQPDDRLMLVLSRVDDFGYNNIEFTEICRYPANQLFDLPAHGISAQLVIVHGNYPELAASVCGPGTPRENSDDVFRALAGVLSPGGVLAGCFVNAHGIRNLLDRHGASRPDNHHLTRRRLIRQLDRRDFYAVRLFALYPGLDAPINLAEVNHRPSVRYSFDQVRYLKNWLGTANYCGKVLLSLLGIALHFEDEYFFFARKR